MHQQSCKPKISYKCKECDQTFATMKLKDAHRRKYHTNSNCEFCDYEVKHAQNLKRHMRTKHKNLTPSRAKQLENLISESNDKKEKKIKCGACHKCFFDKSTLNRHSKNHQIPCKICGKTFKKKEDEINHEKEHMEDGDDASNKVTVKKRTISWANNLNDIREIPTTKLALKEEVIKEIKDMLLCFKRFMVIMLKRGQLCKLSELKQIYERNSKKAFDEVVFRAVLTLAPSALEVEFIEGDIYINILDLENSDEIIDTRLIELKFENAHYVDLIQPPEVKKKAYKSAKETIMENIMKFEEESDNGEEVIEDNEAPFFERLKKKIEMKNAIKKKRELKMKTIDWQLKRLPTLARLIHNIFISEQKSALKKDFLFEKVKHSDYTSTHLVSDFDRLVKQTGSWLIPFKEWVKRRSKYDINNVCNVF